MEGAWLRSFRKRGTEWTVRHSGAAAFVFRLRSLVGVPRGFPMCVVGQRTGCGWEMYLGSLPLEPRWSLWRSLLGACLRWKRGRYGEFFFFIPFIRIPRSTSTVLERSFPRLRFAGLSNEPVVRLGRGCCPRFRSGRMVLVVSPLRPSRPGARSSS